MNVYNDMTNDAGYKYGTQENQQMAQILEQDEINAYYHELAHKHYCEQEYILHQQQLYEKDMMIEFMRLECSYMWE